MKTHQPSTLRTAVCALVAGAIAAAVPFSATAWEPAKPVQFIVPAGTGGGADQMARFIQGVASKHQLMKQPFIVVNESGGAGAQGFLDVKDSKGDPEKIVITLSNLFTTPLTGVPFSWRDLTPVAMLALDEFVLWVNADTPYKTAKQYIDAVKAAPNKFKMGGTGSSRKTRSLPRRSSRPIRASVHLHSSEGRRRRRRAAGGGHIDSTVNNPIEAVAQWCRQAPPAVRVRCAADAVQGKVTADMSWYDIPTCRNPAFRSST
jgi:tripartite-type tricarboxylate transporter receptor subunit TctC